MPVITSLLFIVFMLLCLFCWKMKIIWRELVLEWTVFIHILWPRQAVIVIASRYWWHLDNTFHWNLIPWLLSKGTQNEWNRQYHPSTPVVGPTRTMTVASFSFPPEFPLNWTNQDSAASNIWVPLPHQSLKNNGSVQISWSPCQSWYHLCWTATKNFRNTSLTWLYGSTWTWLCP